MVFSTPQTTPVAGPSAGVIFQENEGADPNTDPNACSMTLTLAAADQMTSFSTECSDEYSCRVGNDVIINVDRWNNATEGLAQRRRHRGTLPYDGHQPRGRPSPGAPRQRTDLPRRQPTRSAHAAAVDGPARLRAQRMAVGRGIVGERVSAAPVTGRLAPSPTGRMHLGNAYAALAAWLGARAKGGRVLLRIEDIDAPRVVKDADRWIMDDLAWLGLDWDGEPVYQSQRLDAYEEALRRLREQGAGVPVLLLARGHPRRIRAE